MGRVATRLLISELVTNAIVHTGTWVGLELRLTGRRLRCAVSDESSRVQDPRRCETSDDAGHGLRLVEELAAEWGVETSAMGEAVWFEVDLAVRDRLRGS
jgi:anti-sigma regulatory factor (Ser/Thr protein kinase)